MTAPWLAIRASAVAGLALTLAAGQVPASLAAQSSAGIASESASGSARATQSLADNESTIDDIPLAPATAMQPRSSLRTPTSDSVLTASSPTSGVIVAGVTWARDAAAVGDVIVNVRTREGETWSPWVELEAASAIDIESVDGELERAGTDPYVAGRVDEIEATVAGGDELSDVQLTVISATPDNEGHQTTTASTDGAGRISTASAVAPALLETAQGQTVAAASSGRPVINSRQQWGADESRMTWQPERADIRSAVVHHTAGTNDYTRADVPGIVRGIYLYHAVTNGWGDIGYNFLVDKFGGIWEGRAGGVDNPIIGAHAYGINAHSVGVSVLGNYETAAFTPAARESVAQVIAWKFATAGVDPLGRSTYGTCTDPSNSNYAKCQSGTRPTIVGHRDVAYTACPGRNIYSAMSTIKARTKEFMSYPVAGGIGKRWSQLGGSGGRLGYPTTVERSTATGGAYQRFQGGQIHWSRSTGAQATWGGIQKRWASLGWESGKLGYPTAGEKSTRTGGSYQRFQGGQIHWSKSTGAHATWGGIQKRWAKLGWENGKLGYPTTEERSTRTGGSYQRFQGGQIHWSKSTGAHATWGGIQKKWASLGWENGRLGYPTSDEISTSTGAYQNFQGGRIIWNAQTRTTSVQY